MWTELKTAIKNSPYTQTQVAAHLDITPSMLSGIIHERYSCKPSHLAKICQLLNVTEHELGRTTTTDTIPHAWRTYCTPLTPSYPQGTEEWVEQRTGAIGASDMSTILGVNKWGSIYQLWEEKTHKISAHNEPSPQAMWGSYLEPGIRQQAAKEKNITIEQSNTVVSIETPYLSYSPDGYFYDDNGDTVLLEIKTVSAFLYDEQWGGNQVAPHAYVQVQQGMYVTGARKALVVVWCDRRALEYRWVAYDEKLVSKILEEGAVFWKHVADDTAPAMDWTDATANLLADEFPPSKAGKVLQVTDEALLDEYKDLKAASERVKKELSRVRNQLLFEMRGASSMVDADGVTRVSWRAGRVNESALRESRPDVWEKYVVEKSVEKLDSARLKSEQEDVYREFQALNMVVR